MLKGILTAFAVMVSSLPAVAKDQFAIGAWTGTAYYDDQTGAFTHCAMSASYQSGDLLLFGINKEGDLLIGISNLGWRLPVGAQTRIVISIDRYPPINAIAENLTENTASASFSDAGDLFYELRRGYVMRIDAGGNSLVYNLTGTYRALERLLNCTASALGVASIGGPPATGPFGSNSTADHATYAAPTNAGSEVMDKSELLVIASNILSDARISGYRFLSIKDAEKLVPGYPVVWIGPGQTTFGALTGLRLTDANVSLADAINAIGAMTLSQDASGCNGDYASGIREETSNAGFITKRLFTACRAKNAADNVLVQYAIFGLPDNEIVKLGVVTVGEDQSEADQPNSTSEQLFNSAVYTLKGQN